MRRDTEQQYLQNFNSFDPVPIEVKFGRVDGALNHAKFFHTSIGVTYVFAVHGAKTRLPMRSNLGTVRVTISGGSNRICLVAPTWTPSKCMIPWTSDPPPQTTY